MASSRTSAARVADLERRLAASEAARTAAEAARIDAETRLAEAEEARARLEQLRIAKRTSMKKAIVAVSGKLATILLAMWKSGNAYWATGRPPASAKDFAAA